MKKYQALLRGVLWSLLLILVTSFLSGCVDHLEETGSSKQFFDMMKKRNGYQLQLLTDFVPVPWNKAYIFTSYTSAQEIYKKVGYRWKRNVSNHNYDNDYTMVFMLDDKVVYDLQGPQDNVGFYNIETELEVDEKTYILCYPKGDADYESASFVIVPEPITSAIEKKQATALAKVRPGKWRINPQVSESGRIILTQEGVIYIGAILEPGLFTQLWAVNSADESRIPVVAYTNQAGKEFEDVNIKLNIINEDDILVELSLSCEGEQLFFEIPFEKERAT